MNVNGSFIHSSHPWEPPRGLAKHRNAILPSNRKEQTHAATWMGLKNLILSGRRLTERRGDCTRIPVRFPSRQDRPAVGGSEQWLPRGEWE